MNIFRLLPAALAVFLFIGDFSAAQPPEGRPRRQREPGAQGGERDERGPREGRAGRGPGQLPIIMALDVDADGEISAEELENAVAVLKKLDKNSDGKLTREEYMGQRRRGGFGAGGAGDPGGRFGGGPARFIDRLMEGDTDEDGKLSKTEVPERMQDRFDEIDADSDGLVSKKELEEMFSRFGGGRQGRGRDGGEGGDRPRRPQRPE